MRYQILIAGPDGCYPGMAIDENAETAAFFSSEQAECFGSMNPEDVGRCDGMVIPGGLPDVNPAYWEEENTACHVVDAEMDERQMAMIERAIALRKPMFGICRGMQLVVVRYGGSLIQDIASGEFHRYEEGNARFHSVRNILGTFMSELYGDSMKVNSGHHQAVKKLPDNFRVSQLWCPDETELERSVALAAADGLHEGTDHCIIEAVYQTDYPFVGLQWHPELRGGLFCKHLDLSKIRSYFYRMMGENRNRANKIQQ